MLNVYINVIYVKGTITVLNTAAAGAYTNNTNKKVIFKNCAPFTSCVSNTKYTYKQYAIHK